MSLSVGYLVECFETFIVDEIHELDRQGVAVTVFNAFRPPPESDPAKEAVRAASLYFPARYRGVLAANIRTLLRHPVTYLGLAGLLVRSRESLRLLVLGAYYAAIAADRRIGHVHATFASRTATLAYVVARLARLPFSFTAHAYDVFLPNPSLNWKTRRAAFVRTISEFNRRFIATTYPDADLSHVVVCYLGVDVQRFRPIPRRPGRVVRVLSVGRLVPTKGHALVEAACGHLVRAGHAISCRIVGDGECRQTLLDEVERLGVQHAVDVSGPLTHDAVRHVLGDSDVFVLACIQAKDSVDQDGLPVALMEAMAMGVPVVSTAISGIPELVEDDVSGLIVPPNDEHALTAAIERLATDPALRERLAQGARRRIEERFDLVGSTRRLVDLFASA